MRTYYFTIAKLISLGVANRTVMHSETDRSRYAKPLDLGGRKRSICICENERFRVSTLANVL